MGEEVGGVAMGDLRVGGGCSLCEVMETMFVSFFPATGS